MKTNFIDLANGCVIFSSVKSRVLDQIVFHKYLENSLLTTTTGSAANVYQDLKNLNLVEDYNGNCKLTNKGRVIAKIAKTQNPTLSKKGKSFFIKNIILNPERIINPCVQVLKEFEPSQKFNTLVLRRTYSESTLFLKWLLKFNSLNLTMNKDNLILINPEYLGSVNNLFKFLRDPLKEIGITEGNNIRNKIGEIAEDLAVIFEQERLSSSGFNELAAMVEKISNIDPSAGYDVISFDGQSPDPDQRRYIEVKGTIHSEISFIWSHNERRVASLLGSKYWIYCYKNVNIDSRSGIGPTTIQNPIETLNSDDFTIEPLDIRYSQQSSN